MLGSSPCRQPQENRPPHVTVHCRNGVPSRSARHISDLAGLSRRSPIVSCDRRCVAADDHVHYNPLVWLISDPVDAQTSISRNTSHAGHKSRSEICDLYDQL
jgi:hypothetical protein